MVRNTEKWFDGIRIGRLISFRFRKINTSVDEDVQSTSGDDVVQLQLDRTGDIKTVTSLGFTEYTTDTHLRTLENEEWTFERIYLWLISADVIQSKSEGEQG